MQSSPRNAGSSRSARSAALRSPAASPTRWASGRCSRCQSCLARHGLKVDDIDLWELNEAFASQVLYCRDRLGIPHGEDQRRRRRDRDRPSLRHERRAHDRSRADRRPPPRRQTRGRHHVHRRRHGRCRPVRDTLACRSVILGWPRSGPRRATAQSAPQYDGHSLGGLDGPSLHAGRKRIPRRGAGLHERKPAAADPRQDDRGRPPRQRGHDHLAAHPQRQGLGGAALAEGMGRHRLGTGGDLSLPRGDAAGPGARAAAVRRQHARPGAHRLRQRGAEEAVPAAHRQSRRLVVPGLLRARRRLRSRLAEDAGQARRRPLRRQRPEDLDDAGAISPTGFSAWCAPIRRRRSRKAFRSS